MLGGWVAFAAAVRERVASPLRTLANLLEAMREGDYSIRGPRRARQRCARRSHAAGQCHGRHAARPATRRAGGDDAAAQGDGGDRRRGLRLRSRPHPAPGQSRGRTAAEPARPSKLLNHSADELGLAEFLEGEDTADRWQRSFPGGAGRWGIGRSSFREGGLPHQAAGGHRPDAAVARGGTAGLAAAGARARPRAEQFAGADQVDRREPRVSVDRDAARRTIGKTTCAAASA